SFRALRRRRRILVLVLVAMAAVAVAGALALRSGGGWATPFLPPASGSAGGGPVSHRSFLERVIPTPAARTTGPAVPRNLTDFPPTDAPSDIKSINQAAAEAAQAAASLRRLGINGVLGPDVDVDTSEGGAYSKLTYSDVPAEVARYAGVTVEAYACEKMLTTPKHFPGL